ncbi:MAG: NTP transferase domain-containing protein, partial [Xanthomonadales bacterium]|nr:NTP transferase domain-containing protein [Xanthomonadales bacterium]
MSPIDARVTTVAILAGGRGERMGGVDKGLVRVGATPLVARVLAVLRGQGLEQAMIVANRSHADYARHAEVIADAAPAFRGPLAGVAAALGACSTPWLLSVPVDCADPP